MEIINRELSWLAFNHRVLQEAMDERVPLIERIRFLGIYSNNLDEFFRVRVANLRRMILVKDNEIEGYKGGPDKLYKEIRKTVLKHQTQFEATYQNIIQELTKHKIYLLDENQLIESLQEEINHFFHDQLKHDILPIMLHKNEPFPKLIDASIYLAVKIHVSPLKTQFALLQIPSNYSRFYQMKDKNNDYVILLDDIIRANIDAIFSVFKYQKIEAYTFKFTRDAELNLDDDLTLSFIEKIEKSLKQRKVGQAVRLVYDEHMPVDLLAFLLNGLNLKLGENTIPGGKYHNFKDFMSFPSFGKNKLCYAKQTPQIHAELENKRSLLKVIEQKDVLLHFPYQKFEYVIDLIREAAIDPKVKSIKINIYRVARNSKIMNALMSAVLNGKAVTVFFELRARFDEENNLYWAEKLKENGAKVIYGISELKVHSKLLQIIARGTTASKEKFYTYIGTGNFNEKTSLIYSDLALITSNVELGREVQKVFRILENKIQNGVFKHLLVSPFNTRKTILHLIDQEIKNAKKGKEAFIKIKLNNFTDAKIINKLMEASNEGVKIEMIIRGISCLSPKKKGRKSIEIISIVDRYLEHARFMIFANAGKPKYYITSADWMERNLDKRIEVATPILDPSVQKEIDLIFDFQWKGSVKSRLIDKSLKNEYRKLDEIFHAQVELYKHYVPSLK
jgi:polyphosphate kinase